MNNETKQVSAFEGYAILELLGHRRLAGYVSEVTFAGSTMIRLDIPPTSDGVKGVTQLYSSSALYCLTPANQQDVEAFAVKNRPAPIQRWELPQAIDTPERPVLGSGYADGDDDDDSLF